MSDKTMKLPYSPHLNVGALSSVFDRKTNSYKYLFFLAIVDFLVEHDFEPKQPIQTTTLGARMLAKAWYSRRLFRLSFGTQDRIADALASYPFEPSKTKRKRLPTEKTLANHFSQKLGIADSLLRYVPQRLIRPFFAKQLRGKRDAVVDKMIIRLSAQEFERKKPLYMFMDDGLVIHPEWLGYLSDNARIVREWALWNFLEYMQQRNPNVPNIAAKLERPAKRQDLTKQREFWNIALRHWEDGQYLCPYSHDPIQQGHYELDHFIPWRFVAHDRLWDLVPATSESNSKKSSLLPSSSYLGIVGELHERAIRYTYRATQAGFFGDEAWHNRVEDYLVDLQFNGINELLTPGKVQSKYKDVLDPLLRIAEQQGFEPGWTYVR